LRADVEFPYAERKAERDPEMPAWLEILLNLVGYAGFVALASRGAASPQAQADDRSYGDDG